MGIIILQTSRLALGGVLYFVIHLDKQHHEAHDTAIAFSILYM